jgi:hypothetical protein
MKKLTTLLAGCGLLLILTGCPYKSTVNLGEPSMKTEKWLKGNWESALNTDMHYEIKALDQFSYAITEVNEADETLNIEYIAWTSLVGKQEYFTVYEPNAEEKGYYFYLKTNISATEFKLSPVTDYIDEQFTSSAALRAYFEQNQHLSFFFAGDEVYTKMTE